jgi:hypothetical protein
MSRFMKFICILVGWNPNVLLNCGEISFAMVKKYCAAIIIISIIWSVIGWFLADKYFGIESWYGKLATASCFIIIIICVERFIILSHGKIIALIIFRIFLAILMSTIGSTIFDQIIFKKDIENQMKSIRTQQANSEIPKRTLTLEGEINSIMQRIDTLNVEINQLSKEITEKPTVMYIDTYIEEKPVGEDPDGKVKFEKVKSVKTTSVPNPKIEQRQDLEKSRDSYHLRLTELQDKKLKLADEIQEEYKNAETGFLEELNAMYILLRNNEIVLIFYCIFFLFLMCLELLVITTKGGSDCDYEKLVQFQSIQKSKRLDPLIDDYPPK